MSGRVAVDPEIDRSLAAVDWPLWSTTARLVVTDPDVLDAAFGLVRAYLDAVDKACSRFRGDSEVSRISDHRGCPVRISSLFAEYLRAALEVAETTGGDVDPTVGAVLVGLGYDRDYTLIGGTATAENAAPMRVTVTQRADWSSIALADRTVTVPDGVLLDLGATAKAFAADQSARLVARELGCGVLVGLGGDIATAGPAPADGWQIEVQDGPGEPRCQIRLPGGAAVATSSTLRRQWFRGGRLVHHIVDPRTGVAAEPVWRTVSVAAGSCLAANAASTASIVRGADALGWLRRSGLPARLVDRDGRASTLGNWPTDREGT
ncbi:FAD:protein FMN transferase [Nocardia sp. NBC_01503]|uniref:FAD:protein FMN transferase n=1 Tax=Nocardia sp. NBC_01503 TaxID=2975997 RepID=UPI002E7C3680|nr:FAD:protein FMN transferase [Nocardia sp. NBC_01503]WTL33374.1 FAD:protein FMN transferase [Nocardia sp. NBC_01503]